MVKKIEGSDDRVIFWSVMQQCSRKSPEHRYFDHEASSGNRETGSASVSRFCLLVAGSVAHPHCPKKFAVYHQLQTGRLSTGEVTLVRNTAATPCSTR